MELSNLVEEVVKQEGTAVKQLTESKFVTYYMLCKINIRPNVCYWKSRTMTNIFCRHDSFMDCRDKVEKDDVGGGGRSLGSETDEYECSRSSGCYGCFSQPIRRPPKRFLVN
jgi:hypothetical protein